MSFRKKISVPFAAALALSMVPASHGAVVWNLTYSDAANVGFNDPTLGATRKARLQDALNLLTETFQALSTGTSTIDLQVRASQFDGTGALGVGGTFRPSAPGFYNGFLYDHATTGVDPFAGVVDARILFDFGYDWHYANSTPPPDKFDFFSVALHELTHAMGFGSAISATGVSTASGNNPGVYTVFESFVTRGNGTPLYGTGGNFLGTPADLTSDDLYFSGPLAMAANGGQRVRLHAPDPFDSGSSVGHLHQSFGTMMTEATVAGTRITGYSPLELAIMQDIGWQLAVVPETEWTVAFGGLCMGIWAISRKRAQST